MITLTLDCDELGWRERVDWLAAMNCCSAEVRPLHCYYTRGKWSGLRVIGGEFKFQDPKEAAAFKLTWGGR